MDEPVIRPLWDASSTLVVSRDVRVRRLDDEWLVHFRANAPANLAFAVSDGAFSALASFAPSAVVESVIGDWSLAKQLLGPFVDAGILIPTKYRVWGRDVLLFPEEISTLRSSIEIETLGLLELESVLLYLLARENPRPEPICELGSFRGGSSIALGLGSRGSSHNNKVLAIDDHEWHRHVAHRVSAEYVENLPSTLPDFLKNIQRAGLETQIQLVVNDTVAAAGEVETDVSIILVDAAHDQRSVSADISAWAPKIVPGGVVAFHDYHSTFWPDVERVVDDFAQEWASAFGAYQTLAIATLGRRPARAG